MLKADQEVAISDGERQVATVRSALQANRSKHSPKSARHDQNNERRVGKKIEYENQVKRHHIPVDG